MFTLNLLGGAAFCGRNGPVEGRAAHRRRVALLAILSLARGRTVGRERIVGLLWPDQTAAGARHLLSESLYVLRKELGADAFGSAGDEVGLNGSVVRSDVEAFEDAIEAGELERAAQVYRGPFLDGFFVADAPEFERWAEGERSRLAHAHARAVECLAAAADREGRPAQAAEWWRRLAVLDPYDSRVGVRLMLALDAAGQRAAALWFAETHTAFLRDELGVEPEGEFAELVERLRTEPVRVAAPPPPPAPEAAGDGFGAPAEPGDAGMPAPARSLDQAGDGGELDAAPAIVAMLSGEPSPSAAPARAAGEAAGVGGEGARTGTGGGEEQGDRWRDAAEGGSGARRARRPVWLATLAAVVAAVAFSVSLLAPRWAHTEEPRPAGYDPHRIAVLYFDDHSPGGELGYLANGLTEILIHQLSQVEALDVVSRNAVKAHRDHPAPFDSLVGDLRVGTVVEGSVQRSGGAVRVAVQLVDAATRSHLDSRTIVYPLGDVFALEDALADSVSGFLRRRLGQEIKLRRVREETRSATAWRRVMEAEAASDAAVRFLRDGTPQDAASAARSFARADSLLAAAERADPAWARPTVLRGWVAFRSAGLARSPRARADSALAHAERALARAPGNAPALELRGFMRFGQVLASSDGAGQTARLDAAEADLRAAVAADPKLATAWANLGQLLRYRGRALEADAAARRALQEDAYLDGADALLSRLFFSAMHVGDYARADSACQQGRARFPGDWKFVQCPLLLLRADTSRPADAAYALRLLAEANRVDPPARARREGRAYAPVFRQAVVAAVLARAGAADSARAMLARARREVENDGVLSTSLAYDAAYVHRLLGEPDSARALLARAFTRRPEMREFASRDPLFRGLPLPTPQSASRAARRARSRPDS